MTDITQYYVPGIKAYADLEFLVTVSLAFG